MYNLLSSRLTVSIEKSICGQESDSQRFIFSITCKSAQLTKVLQYSWLEWLASENHCGFTSPFVRYEEKEVSWIQPQGPYSQHFVFFVTCKWTQQVRALQNTKPERLASYKHSSLMLEFLRYEEKEVLWIQPQGPYSQHFVSFVTYKWTQEVISLHNTNLKRLAICKHSILLGAFLSC